MLTPGQASDLVGFDALVEQIASDTLLADKSYDADKRVRSVLSALGKRAVIPGRRNRTTPVSYDKGLYKERHKVENCFSRLKDFRAIATRYDKTARNFLAGVCLAAAMQWIN